MSGRAKVLICFLCTAAIFVYIYPSAVMAIDIPLKTELEQIVENLEKAASLAAERNYSFHYRLSLNLYNNGTIQLEPEVTLMYTVNNAISGDCIFRAGSNFLGSRPYGSISLSRVNFYLNHPRLRDTAIRIGVFDAISTPLILRKRIYEGDRNRWHHLAFHGVKVTTGFGDIKIDSFLSKTRSGLGSNYDAYFLFANSTLTLDRTSYLSLSTRQQWDDTNSWQGANPATRTGLLGVKYHKNWRVQAMSVQLQTEYVRSEVNSDLLGPLSAAVDKAVEASMSLNPIAKGNMQLKYLYIGPLYPDASNSVYDVPDDYIYQKIEDKWATNEDENYGYIRNREGIKVDFNRKFAGWDWNYSQENYRQIYAPGDRTLKGFNHYALNVTSPQLTYIKGIDRQTINITAERFTTTAISQPNRIDVVQDILDLSYSGYLNRIRFTVGYEGWGIYGKNEDALLDVSKQALKCIAVIPFEIKRKSLNLTVDYKYYHYQDRNSLFQMERMKKTHEIDMLFHVPIAGGSWLSLIGEGAFSTYPYLEVPLQDHRFTSWLEYRVGF